MSIMWYDVMIIAVNGCHLILNMVLSCQSFDADTTVTLGVIIDSLCSNQVFCKKEEEEDEEGGEGEDTSRSATASHTGNSSDTTDTISTPMQQMQIPSLTSKQCTALVGKNIRDMIKAGSIFGLTLSGSASDSGSGTEYSYHMNPLWRQHDCASTPVLCLSLEDRVSLRVFRW